MRCPLPLPLKHTMHSVDECNYSKLCYGVTTCGGMLSPLDAYIELFAFEAFEVCGINPYNRIKDVNKLAISLTQHRFKCPFTNVRILKLNTASCHI